MALKITLRGLKLSSRDIWATQVLTASSPQGTWHELPEGRHPPRDIPDRPELVAGVPGRRGGPDPRRTHPIKVLPAAVS